MELTNDFEVGVPVEQAWDVLTDLERIAPCMPGAQLQEIEGDEYRGIIKVKVGPITAQYKGAARFVERDESARRAVVRAEGRETRGQGNASATITATLAASGDGTAVNVATDLAITGKVAQLGRGVLADVSSKLLDQFVAALEQDVLSGSHDAGPVVEPEAAAASEPEEVASVVSHNPGTAPVHHRTIDAPEPKPVDLLDAAGAPIAKRLAPAAAVLALLWLLRVFLRRRRS
jgi:carbon monoxide dehydrogenase subunit G